MNLIINEQIKYIKAGVDTIKQTNPSLSKSYKQELQKIEKLIKKPFISINYLSNLTNAYFFIVDTFNVLEESVSEEAMLLIKTFFCYYFYWYDGDTKKADYFSNIVKEDKIIVKKIIINKNFHSAHLSMNNLLTKKMEADDTNT